MFDDQTVSFSSSGQPISVFNVNEEYKYLIPNEIPVSEGLSALFKPVLERYWRYKVGRIAQW